MSPILCVKLNLDMLQKYEHRVLNYEPCMHGMHTNQYVKIFFL